MGEIDMTIKMGATCFSGIRDLDEGRSIDETELLGLVEFVNQRYDCADFRMVSLIRTRYAYWPLLTVAARSAIEASILGFKYWMDEPGDDDMCFWSENHQILFAAVEYLAGRMYPENVFTNDGLTGYEHAEKAALRIHRWLGYRFRHGFTEWHSNTYYEEDIAPLTLLIDFSDDAAMAVKSTMVMDLLLLDLAMHSYRGFFCATSGRCYEAQKKDPARQDTLEIAEKVWGFGNVKDYNYRRISANFFLMKNYRVPEVILAIGRDTAESEIMDSMGLDLSEVRGEFGDPSDIDTAGMFLWAMESFTNPESVNLTLKIYKTWKLQRNSFLKDLRTLDLPVLRSPRILPTVVRALNPVTQGIAIQRANTYTFRTDHFMLSTAQAHHPGEFSDQQHVWQATLPGGVTVFTTHPGASVFDDSDRNFSPSYWVGNGIFPHAAGHRAVTLCIYNLRLRRGFMERGRKPFTHAFFPRGLLDESLVEERRLFGRKADSYIALIAGNPLRVNPEDADDIIQDGTLTYWICELGSIVEFGSFEAFIAAIRARPVDFSSQTLRYDGKHKLSLCWRGEFRVDGAVVDTNYGRYDTPWVKAGRHPAALQVRCGTRALDLDFQKLERLAQ